MDVDNENLASEVRSSRSLSLGQASAAQSNAATRPHTAAGLLQQLTWHLLSFCATVAGNSGPAAIL